MDVSGTRLLLASAMMMAVCSPSASARQQSDQPVFRSSVDLVSVTAVVRDKRGRSVRSLQHEDFEISDGGLRRQIVDVQSDATAPASIAFLIDGSGSMRGQAAVEAYRRICEALLVQLNAQRDDVALMSFDTRLLTLREFTSEFESIRRGLEDVDTFGATSIYDAIAGTAAIVADHTRQRRAVVVITDGSDNASAYTPEQVAWIASTIDVPVYVFAVGDPLTPKGHSTESAAHADPLMALARATGGDFFHGSNATYQHIAIGRVVEELRHQYLITFEPLADHGGVRKIDVRTRYADLKVRSRQWYSAGAGD